MYKLYFLMLLNCLFFKSVSGQSATTPYNSLLWEISGNGLPEKSYLYGTMHVSSRIAFHLTDTFFIALKHCDMVALESDPEIWMDELLTNNDLFSETEYNFVPETYYYQTPENFFESSFTFSATSDDALTNLLRIEPVHINTLMYRSYYGGSDYEEDTWLDMYIYQTGKKLGKQIGGLEDLKTTIKMSKEAEQMDSKEIQEHDKKIKKSSLNGFRFNEKLQEAYRNADLNTLDSIAKIIYTEKYTRIMINDRNLIMAESMDSIMQSKRLFAAVGAAHLPGENGVINILKNMGYVVRPVFPLKNKVDDWKSKLDARSYSNKYQIQTSPDSNFKVALPGPVYHIESEGAARAYLYPDLANGAYYSIYELSVPQKYSSNGAYLAKVDSLLFEHIPGKIISKHRFLLHGIYPAIQLTIFNRRGNYERYQFVQANDFFYLLKLSGNGTFANQNIHHRFFDTFQPQRSGAETHWTNMVYPENGYQFQIPGVPVETTSDETYSGRFREVVSKDTDGNTFLFLHNFYIDWEYLEEDTFELRFIAERFSKSLGYNMHRFEYLDKNGLPVCRAASSNDAGDSLFVSVSTKGPDYYLMAVLGSTTPLPFFNSLTLFKPEYSEIFEYQEDTIYKYAVLSQIKAIDLTKTMESEYPDDLSSDEGPETDIVENVDADDFRIEYNNFQYLRCHKTNEIIKLDIDQLSPYLSKAERDSIWMSGCKRHFSGHSFSITNEVRWDSDTSKTYAYQVVSPNSTKAIRVKSIFTGDRIYDLYTYVDTVYGASAWVDTFFSSFTPTCQQIDYRLLQLDSVLINLTGDSVNRAIGLQQIQDYSFKDTDAPAFVSFLRQCDFNQFDAADKTMLYSFLEDMHHPVIIEYIASIYYSLSDSSYLQYILLKSLLSNKDSISFVTFVQLLEQNTPVFSNNYELSQLYDYLYDAPELLPRIINPLLKISIFPDYKSKSLELASWLLNQKMIQPSEILFLKHDIIIYTQYLIKWYQSELQSDERPRYEISYNYQVNSFEYGYDTDLTHHLYSAYDTISESERKKKYANRRINVDSYNRLHPFVDLLLPYYSEPEIKQMIDKIDYLFPSEVNLMTNIAKLKYGIPTPDSIWYYYVKNEKSRILCTDFLLLLGKKDVIDTSLLSQEALSRIFLMAKTENAPDSLILYRKASYSSIKGNGVVYFYTIHEGAEKHLGWVLFSDNQQSATFNLSDVQIDLDYGTEEDDELVYEEKISLVVHNYSLKNRKRLNSYPLDY